MAFVPACVISRNFGSARCDLAIKAIARLACAFAPLLSRRLSLVAELMAAAMAQGDLKTCYKCGEEKPSDQCRVVNKQKVAVNPKVAEFVICKDCGSAAARVSKLLSANPNLREAYATLDKDAFLQEFKTQKPEAMKAHLEQVL